jgi:hypothetical protein
VHLRIYSSLFIRASEIFLWCVDHKLCKFRVPIEDTDALDDVAMIKFISLAGKRNLLSNKFWKPIWKLFVNDQVEFVST